MAVTSAFAYGSGLSWFDDATGSVKQVSAYYYRAGTLDPITVYTTSDLSIPFPLPVLTTGYGKMPPIWIGTQAAPGYRIRIFDQYSTLVEDVDNIPGPVDPTGGSGGGGTINPGDPRLYATGDLIFAMSNAQPRAGAVLCNGLSVGSINSTYATGRANDDTKNLFLYLWGQDLFGLLAVQPARGSTAQGDWDANKAIAVPDLMGKVLVGMDAMGTTAKNRLASVPMQLGTQEKLAAQGGQALHTLTAAEVPDHQHTATQVAHNHTGASPDHVHAYSGSTGTVSAFHTHSGTTGGESATHTHSVPTGGSSASLPIGSPSGATVASTAGTTTGTQSANHTHSFTTGTESANHTHTFGGSTGGSDRSLAFTTSTATPAITVSPTTGGGGAHNSTPLFMTCAVYVKL